MGGSSYVITFALSVDASGVVTVAGETGSTNFPTTIGAYDTTYNGGHLDAFISRLDLSKTGTAQLVYSTFLGGSGSDYAHGLSVDASGVLTVAGGARPSNFPTTIGAYDTTHNGSTDTFVSRLDPSKTGSAQLVYSTFLGGSGIDSARAFSVDAGGVVTVAGWTRSTNFPTTIGAYDTTFNGGDAFVSRLDPSKTGSTQLVYSTFLGGSSGDFAFALSVDASGVVTVAGTGSTNFPTTSGAYQTTGPGVFVSRLDPSRTTTAQLVYSTFLGGGAANALSVDASGVVTVAGETGSPNFPTTIGAYDTTYNGSNDAFISRLDMGVALWADTHQLSLKQAGTQKLTLNAGKQHAGRLYWIFGSMTGTAPGVTLNGVHIPLTLDQYTGITIVFPNLVIQNTVVLKNFKGTLDSNGRASASFNLPSGMPPIPFTLYHAYLVYDAQGTWHMASNPVPLRLVN